MLRQTKYYLTRSKRLVLEVINYQELNLMEGRIPPMFENMGILRQM